LFFHLRASSFTYIGNFQKIKIYDSKGNFAQNSYLKDTKFYYILLSFPFHLLIKPLTSLDYEVFCFMNIYDKQIKRIRIFIIYT